VATTLAALAELHAAGTRPHRDLVLAFSADEEAGGHKGVKHLVKAQRDVFDGVSEAIGEVGGFSIPVPGGRRLYPVQVAEKGQAWARLTAHGASSHGAMEATDSALLRLARTVDRIGAEQFPVHLVKSCRAFLDAAADAHGIALDEADPGPVLDRLGAFARMIGPTTRHTANPTMFESGYKLNVVPERAVAHVDGRFLPGLDDDFTERFTALLEPGVEHEWVHHDIAVETELDGPLVGTMASALTAEDPAAELVPFCMPGGTDAKTYSTLGIRCFGFMPLRLPPSLDFAAMFHGVDERVPVESLEFGTRVMRRLLTSA
jgi:acetylornithine deacetylase/succinyl-diaminopimelate desuccinylase-like protein